MTVAISAVEVLTVKLDDEYIQESVVVPAMREAMQIIGDLARENLQEHQSIQTGTALWWTDKGKEQAAQRRPLVDSVRISAYWWDGEAVGTVSVEPEAAHIGRFMEYGTDDATTRVYGNYTGRGRVPYPFLRPAYERGRLRAERAFRRILRQRFADRPSTGRAAA